MTQDERVDALAEQVRLDLLDQLHDLQDHGRQYINEYVSAFLGPKTTWRPRPAFHPKLAELIRELASEAAMTDRRACGAVALSDNRGDGRKTATRPSRRVAA